MLGGESSDVCVQMESQKLETWNICWWSINTQFDTMLLPVLCSVDGVRYSFCSHLVLKFQSESISASETSITFSIQETNSVFICVCVCVCVCSGWLWMVRPAACDTAESELWLMLWPLICDLQGPAGLWSTLCSSECQKTPNKEAEMILHDSVFNTLLTWVLHQNQLLRRRVLISFGRFYSQNEVTLQTSSSSTSLWGLRFLCYRDKLDKLLKSPHKSTCFVSPDLKSADDNVKKWKYVEKDVSADSLLPSASVQTSLSLNRRQESSFQHLCRRWEDVQ